MLNEGTLGKISRKVQGKLLQHQNQFMKVLVACLAMGKISRKVQGKLLQHQNQFMKALVACLAI